MSATNIGFEDCKALSELLASSKYMEVYDRQDDEFSCDSVQLIVDGLSHNTSLEKLYRVTQISVHRMYLSLLLC